MAELINNVQGVLHKVQGGGTRSEKAPPYHLVPATGIRRIAQRFGLGAEKHGPENWKKSCETEADARAWCEEAYNHMQEHAQKMLSGAYPDDDHVGAIGWAVCIFAYVEEKFQKRWTDLSLTNGATIPLGDVPYHDQLCTLCRIKRISHGGQSHPFQE